MTDTMRAVVKPASSPGFEMRRVPIPAIGPADVLVRVRAASICGTDLHVYRWDPWAASRVQPPVVVGHEVCGDVVDRGSMVTTPNIGEFVSLESHVICNTCAYCRTGQGHICQNTRLIGIDRDGASPSTSPSRRKTPGPIRPTCRSRLPFCRRTSATPSTPRSPSTCVPRRCSSPAAGRSA